MQQQLTCSQVGALLTFYIENRLNEQLRKYVEYHLSICPSCMEKYKKLTKLVSNYNEVKSKLNQIILKMKRFIIRSNTKNLEKISPPILTMNLIRKKICA